MTYTPAAEEMAEARNWLYTPEGRAWADEQVDGPFREGRYNYMSSRPWICLKNQFRRVEVFWHPGRYIFAEEMTHAGRDVQW